MKRKNSYYKGVWAEKYAECLLRLKGYAILERRYKTPFGEIDLLARKGNALVCVEVKYRPTQDEALEAVDPRSQKRITAAAEFFRAHHPHYQDNDVRFDILTVVSIFGVRHHKNAWYAA